LVGQTLDVTAQDMSNVDGRIQAHQLALTGGDLNNTHGVIYAENADLAIGELNNQYGFIQAEQNLNLTAAGIDNRNTLAENQGIAGANVTIEASALDNQDGSLIAEDLLGISVQGTVKNSGTITSGNELSLHASALNNHAAGSISASTSYIEVDD